jgi:adenylosuccinate synthase
MAIDVIVGLQRGDEGKGRFVDLEAREYDVIARGNGGANAGHTVVPDGMEPIALHQIPSGIAHPDKLNVIGNGVYLDPLRLQGEIQDAQEAGIEVSSDNLLISDIAHLVMPHHVALDQLRETSDKEQGSTKSGIAYVACDKYLREGIRAESIDDPKMLFDLAYEGLCRVRMPKWNPWKKVGSNTKVRQEARDWVASAQRLSPHITDTVGVVNDRLKAGNRVLAEGAQAHWLDINHGMYPAVTSSSTTVSGLLDGLGVSAKNLGKVTGVAKIIKSHVGGGPFVTQVHDEQLANRLRGPEGMTDSEYGATTNRPRRVGYPDIVELQNAVAINGVDELVLSKIDRAPRFGSYVLVATSYLHNGQARRTAPSSAKALEECEPFYRRLKTWEIEDGVRKYDDLPAEATEFVELFEDKLGLPVTKLGVGPKRNQVIIR